MINLQPGEYYSEQSWHLWPKLCLECKPNKPSQKIFIFHSFFVLSLFTYCKILIISPGLIFVQKAFLLGLFSGSLFLERLIIGWNFAFQNGLGLSLKSQL